jgi:nucleoside 2-deoxyribosyltransferase
MRIYFAGPLFSEAEKSFNMKLAGQLESAGFSIFLPQRDGAEKNKSPYSEMTDDDRRKAMFEIDRDEILKADIFLFILDGRVPDEGASVELGIAYAQKYLTKTDKILVGLHTDSRAAFIGSKLNPMLKVSLDYIADNEQDLLSFLLNK